MFYLFTQIKLENGCIEAAKENGVKVIGFSENQK